MQHTKQETPVGLLEQKDGTLQALTFAYQTESLAQVAHDARNMATVLDLYCDLLQEPGVLAAPFSHYGGELKHVAATSRALVERLAALNVTGMKGAALVEPNWDLIPSANHRVQRRAEHWRNLPGRPIENLAAEVLASRNFLSALAGPTVKVTIDVEGGAWPVRLAGEELTRILINLVKNAAEAMSSVGRVHISLRESAGDLDRGSWLTLNVEDNGPGFPDRMLANIFEKGKDARVSLRTARGDRRMRQRGLGLSIVRSLVEAAGGRIHAANRDPGGACIQIELPVRPFANADSTLKKAGDSVSFN